MADIRVIHGDMRAELATLRHEGVRVHSIVTDPPYGLAFMGRHWDAPDNVAFQYETWRLCFDLLPPGGHMLCFGGTRTFHRLVCAIEDAGFEIRDTISWNFGSGFPKGLNVVNQLIKLALCQSQNHALCAAQSSVSTLVRSGKVKAPIAVALAQILPGDGQGLLTEIGGEVALHVPMDTWPSEWMAHIGLNTTSSLSSNLEDVCSNTSKCITSTASERITDQRTYDWLIGLHISATTTRCSVTLPNGCEWPALAAASNSIDSSESNRSILIVTALGDAIWNPVTRFDGFNISLKPAMELVCVARKPLIGTIAANVVAHGTGALNIDGCRIETDEDIAAHHGTGGGVGHTTGAWVETYKPGDAGQFMQNKGRWPANVAHDGSAEVVKAFPETQSGLYKAGSTPKGERSIYGQDAAAGWTTHKDTFGDSGSAARFFYSSKADAADRLQSRHPTVKPVDLMRWLVRLVTPPGGTVLDPFAGSGTTGMACMAEGFDCILIEREAEYVADIKARIAHVRGDDTPLFAVAAE